MPATLGFRHRFVPAVEGSGPVLLLLHGTGDDENGLVPLGRALGPHAALLSPRGPVLENGMPRFFRRLAEGVFDIEDLKKRTDDLTDFVSAAAARYGFDAKQVVAIGYSNGANIAASLLLRRPGTLAGAALFRPMVPFEPETIPQLGRVPVLITSGRGDRTVPPGDPERLTQMLEKGGAEVSLHWHDGGHVIVPQDLDRAREWLHRYFLRSHQ